MAASSKDALSRSMKPKSKHLAPVAEAVDLEAVVVAALAEVVVEAVLEAAVALVEAAEAAEIVVEAVTEIAEEIGIVTAEAAAMTTAGNTLSSI
jgi:hypothetical protein